MTCRLKLCMSISPDLMDKNPIYFEHILIPDPGTEFCKIFEIKRFSHFLTLYITSRSVCYNFTVIGKNEDIGEIEKHVATFCLDFYGVLK